MLTESSGNAGDCCSRFLSGRGDEVKGPIADDEAKMDPNDGHGDGGRENGIDPEGEDTSADDEGEGGADCSWRLL